MENEKELSERGKIRLANKLEKAKMDISTDMARSDLLCNSLFINARRNIKTNFEILQAKKLTKVLEGEALLNATKEMLMEIIKQL